MLVSEYLDKYVTPAARPFARVVVSAGLKFTHMTLNENQVIPEEDLRNITLFIQVDRDAMPPDLIADHNCSYGWVCVDHSDKPQQHDGCYGESSPCPYPGCQTGQESEVTVVNVGYPDDIGEHLGAGS